MQAVAGGPRSPVAGDGRQEREGTQDDGPGIDMDQEKVQASGVDRIMLEDRRGDVRDRQNRTDDGEHEEHREPSALEAMAEGSQESQGGHRPHAPADGVVIRHRREAGRAGHELRQVGRDGMGGVVGVLHDPILEGQDGRDVGGRGRQAE